MDGGKQRFLARACTKGVAARHDFPNPLNPMTDPVLESPPPELRHGQMVLILVPPFTQALAP
jgi:hypothetical protein